MFFTKEDYKKIEDWFKHRAVKDSQFPETDDLGDCDLIPIVQEGENKTIHVCRLFEIIKSQSEIPVIKLDYDLIGPMGGLWDSKREIYVQDVETDAHGNYITDDVSVGVFTAYKDGNVLTTVDNGGELFGISLDPEVPDKTENGVELTTSLKSAGFIEDVDIYVKIWPEGDQSKEVIKKVTKHYRYNNEPFIIIRSDGESQYVYPNVSNRMDNGNNTTYPIVCTLSAEQAAEFKLIACLPMDLDFLQESSIRDGNNGASEFTFDSCTRGINQYIWNSTSSNEGFTRTFFVTIKNV